MDPSHANTTVGCALDRYIRRADQRGRSCSDQSKRSRNHACRASRSAWYSDSPASMTRAFSARATQCSRSRPDRAAHPTEPARERVGSPPDSELERSALIGGVRARACSAKLQANVSSRRVQPKVGATVDVAQIMLDIDLTHDLPRRTGDGLGLVAIVIVDIVAKPIADLRQGPGACAEVGGHARVATASMRSLRRGDAMADLASRPWRWGWLRPYRRRTSSDRSWDRRADAAAPRSPKMR
jgi:hypothetical protein